MVFSVSGWGLKSGKIGAMQGITGDSNLDPVFSILCTFVPFEVHLFGSLQRHPDEQSYPQAAFLSID